MSAERKGERRNILKRSIPPLPLLFLFIFSIVLIFLMTVLRYQSFLDTNWDLGINMQALWTNTHGYLLFESADYQTSGVVSFLEVNSAYIAIPISWLYALFPNAYLLFAIQAVVVSLTVFPIYFYTERRLSNPLSSLIISALFILGFAVLSGVFYDFHWESFIPVEFFTFIYLFSERKYALSIIPVIIGALTLEVFPFLSASYLLFALISPAEIGMGKYAANKKTVRYYALLILLFSGLLYYTLAFAGGSLIPGIVGQSTSSVGASVHAISYLLNFGLAPGTLLNSVVYWLLLLTSLGSVPLLRGRSLIVVLPWVYWSVIAYPLYTAQFGLQYGLIATSLLFVPFIEGLKRLKKDNIISKPTRSLPLLLGPLSILAFSIYFGTTSVFTNHRELLLFAVAFSVIIVATVYLYKFGIGVIGKRIKFPVSVLPAKKIYFIFLILLLIVSITIGPLNPMNKSPPFTGGYAVSFTSNPSFSHMNQVESIVGHNSTVLTMDNLFPFVANNPNAYSFFWYPADYSNNQFFPYKQNSLPEYLLLDQSQMYTVPHYIYKEAFNSTQYGLRLEIVNNGYPGNIYLFQMNFHGGTVIIDS